MDCNTNSLKDLNHFTNRNNTFQQINHNPQPVNHSSFKREVRNGHQDFEQFKNDSFQSSFQPQQYNPQFQQQSPLSTSSLQQRNLPQDPLTRFKNDWVKDFSKISIGVDQSQPIHNGVQHRDLQMNGMHQMNHMPQMNNMHQMNNIPQMNNMHQMNNMQQMNMNMNMNMSEHQQLHRQEINQQIDHQDFENEFKLIESEQSQMDNQTETSNIHEEEFANTAKQIKQTLEGNAKFKDSNFLKLMNSISNKNIALNHEGDKLIDQQGHEYNHDIEQPLQPMEQQSHQPLQLSEEQLTGFRRQGTEEINYHQPLNEFIPQYETPASQQQEDNQPQVMFDHYGNRLGQDNGKQTVRESETIRNHLPDPLAHLKGELNVNEPLLAARIVSGNQVNHQDWLEDYDASVETPASLSVHRQPNRLMGDWQEVYDDYRHDDDYH